MKPTTTTTTSAASKPTVRKQFPIGPPPTNNDQAWIDHERLCPIPALLEAPDGNPNRFRVLPGLRCMLLAKKLGIQVPALTRALYFGRLRSRAVTYFNTAVGEICDIPGIDVNGLDLVDWIAAHPYSVWYRADYKARYGLHYGSSKKKPRERR